MKAQHSNNELDPLSTFAPKIPYMPELYVPWTENYSPSCNRIPLHRWDLTYLPRAIVCARLDLVSTDWREDEPNLPETVSRMEFKYESLRLEDVRHRRAVIARKEPRRPGDRPFMIPVDIEDMGGTTIMMVVLSIVFFK